MARRTWYSLFRTLFGGISGNQTKQAQRPNLALEIMEDRTTPVATAFSGGVLSLDLNFASEAVTLSNDGTNITISSSNTITGDGASFATSGVTSIAVTDSGSNSGQSLTFAAGTAIINATASRCVRIDEASICRCTRG